MSRFQPNPRLEAELAASAAAASALVKAATVVKAKVEREKHSVMPRKSTRPVVVEVEGDEVRVVNTDHGAWIDEIGSVNSPPAAPLRRSARAAGLRLTEHGK
jgi:hypothetical protein